MATQRYWFWYKKPDGTISNGSAGSQSEAEKDIGKSNILTGKLGTTLPTKPSSTSTSTPTQTTTTPTQQTRTQTPTQTETDDKTQSGERYYAWFTDDNGNLKTLSGDSEQEVLEIASDKGWSFKEGQTGSFPAKPEITPTEDETTEDTTDETPEWMTPEALNERTQQAIDFINNSGLPEDLKAMYADMIRTYPPGIEFDAQEMINTFNKIKDNTIDPHFKELADLAVNEIQQNLSSSIEQRTAQTEQEEINKQQAIASQQKSLEARGMTFSGEGVKQLGAESAFGGQLGGEGLIPQQKRMLATSSKARYEDYLNTLGRGVESQLGTGALGQFNIPNYQQVGGITGSLETQKQGVYGGTMSDLLSQYRQKQQSNQSQF